MTTTPTPFRALSLGPYEATQEIMPDGSLLLRNAHPLQPYPRCYTETLMHWATVQPTVTLLAQRVKGGDWRHLTYADAVKRIMPIAQALLHRGLSAERPLMILSENSIEHALLALAALHVGIPFAPISPAYSLLSKSAERVRHAADLLTPGAVFAYDAGRYENAILAAIPPETELIFVEGEVAGRRSTHFSELEAYTVTAAVQQAHQAVTGDTIAKFLFTSGSTKLPKAVINTQRMVTCNPQMHMQCYPFVREEPPVLVDWMPWHHTAAGNNNFGVVVHNGGTMYIDEGKPTNEGMVETLRNLREIPSTIYYSVPKGLEVLAHEMKRDTVLRETFFSRLRLIFPSGAALPAPLKQTIDELAIQTVGARIPMTAGLGMTESAPFATSAHLADWQAGVVGIPAPGCDVKLTPNGDKLEVRYRGPNITPGYWRQPDMTAEAFDADGFFCSGDAAIMIEEGNPSAGLRFNGRIAEDFKLISGTWVNVGAMRTQIIAAGAPFIHDAVITGHDRDELGMMILLLPTATALSRDLNENSTLDEMASNPEVRAWAQDLLNNLAAKGTGSSNRVVRALLLKEPALMELGEMTDKGSINQRTMLRTRAALVEKLYAVQPDDDDVMLAQPQSAKA